MAILNPLPRGWAKGDWIPWIYKPPYDLGYDYVEVCQRDGSAMYNPRVICLETTREVRELNVANLYWRPCSVI